MALACAALALPFRSLAAGTNPAWIENLPKVQLSGSPAAAPRASEEGFINLSLDQVDVASFVKLVGDVTGRKFVVADGVKGKITVVSPRVSRSEVYPLFVSILESSGCSVIQEGDLYRVVAMPERTTHFAPVVGSEEHIPASGVITKIFRLKHASASDVRKLLEPRVSGGKQGAVGAVEETNHLIVTDTAENIRRIEKLVQELDEPGMARVTEVVPLQFIGAENLAEELNAAIAESQSRADRLRSRLPAAPDSTPSTSRAAVVVASPHSNSLILVGAPAQVQDLRRLVQIMDVDAQTGRGNLNAIFLKYLSAEEAAKSLNALLAAKPGEGKESGPLKRRIAVEASAANNALLVDATPTDFEVVKKLVEQLDQVQQQVHIEVLIAELSTSDSLDLGVEMAAIDLPSAAGDYAFQGSSRIEDNAGGVIKAVQQGILPKGLSVGVAHGIGYDVNGKVVLGYPGLINIDAVKKNSRFQIRSNPSLMAQNNKEASVNIVNDIPVLKSTIAGGTGSARDVIQNIDRMNVGIKLKLTPSVIPGGQVRMVLNPVIEAVTDKGPDGSYTPIIARREVTTTVTVRDGEMIVIAGLTREDQAKTVQKVPILGSIPLLGWLFRRTVDGTEKTNVLIFVTPRIVADSAAGESMTRRMEQKTGLKADEHP